MREGCSPDHSRSEVPSGESPSLLRFSSSATEGYQLAPLRDISQRREGYQLGGLRDISQHPRGIYLTETGDKAEQRALQAMGTALALWQDIERFLVALYNELTSIMHALHKAIMI